MQLPMCPNPRNIRCCQGSDVRPISEDMRGAFWRWIGPEHSLMCLHCLCNMAMVLPPEQADRHVTLLQRISADLNTWIEAARIEAIRNRRARSVCRDCSHEGLPR